MGADRFDRAGVSGGGGVTAEWGPHGLQVTDPRRRPHWALITGQAAGTNRYAHAQVDDADPDGGFPGQTSTAGGAVIGTSDATGQPAYEVNGRTDVPANSTVRVKLWPSRSGKYWLFRYDDPPTACVSYWVEGVAFDAAATWYGGPAIALPDAGTYRVTFEVHVSAGAAAGDSVTVHTRVYNCTAGAAVLNSYRRALVLTAPASGGASNYAYHTVAVQLTVTGPTTLQLQGRYTGTSAAGATGFDNNGVPADDLGTVTVGSAGYVRVRHLCAEASGCPDGGGSGSGGGDPGGEGESFFDLGESATATFSDATGDCTCLNGLSGTLTKTSAQRWDNVGGFDTSGCPTNGDATDNFGLAYSGDGWRAVSISDQLDCEFISQDSAAKTVVIRLTHVAGVGDSKCTGTAVVTFVGS